MKSKLTPEMEKEIAELTGQMSQAEIAAYLTEKYGEEVTKSMVNKAQKRLGVKSQQNKSTAQLIQEEKKRIQTEMTKKELEQLLAERSKLEIVIDSIKEAIVPFEPEPINLQLSKRSKADEEVAVLLLSDLHIGKKTKSYNSDVFVRRLRELTKHLGIVINILRQTYPIRKLIILGLGDFVDHVSIYRTQAWHVDQHTMNQIYRVGIPELCTFMQAMSNFFKEVEFDGVRGNHGRAGKYLPEELNYDLILYETLRLACQNLKNVKFEISWDWYTIKEIMGHKFLLTHGDVIRSWLNIPFYGETQKGMRWQGALNEEWDYLVLGHWHTIHRLTWNNFEIIGNGCFVTDDDYPTQILGLKSENRQLLFGIHPIEKITWEYKLRLE